MDDARDALDELRKYARNSVTDKTCLGLVRRVEKSLIRADKCDKLREALEYADRMIQSRGLIEANSLQHQTLQEALKGNE